MNLLERIQAVDVKITCERCRSVAEESSSVEWNWSNDVRIDNVTVDLINTDAGELCLFTF
jgi:hypothetical protein